MFTATNKKSKKWGSGWKHIYLAAVMGYFSSRALEPVLLHHGTPAYVSIHERPMHAAIDPSNDSLRLKHGKLKKIFERVEEGKQRVMLGPQAVVIGKNGEVFVLTEQAKLIRLMNMESRQDGLTIMATAIEVKDLGMGRPLGGAFAPDGTLYIVDTLLGLIRVKNPLDTRSKVELIASRVNSNDKWSKILYCNDLSIGPKTGKVYFSDASDIAPRRDGTRTWDILYMAKLDFLRGERTGRVLEYDPATDKVRVLIDNLWFANGIGIDKDEQYLIISETFRGRVLKYSLKDGSTLVVNDRLTGYPDGATCDHESGLCYVPVPSSPSLVQRAIFSLPDPLDRCFRVLMSILPKWLAPAVGLGLPYGGLYELFPGDMNKPAATTRLFQDPDGQDITMLTRVTVHHKKVYLGSLHNEYIGVLDLN